jgi:type IV pilus assembly protein PilC
MPTFRYSAMQGDGRTISGTVEAPSKQECVNELRKRNLTPLDIDEGGGFRSSGATRAKGASAKKRGTFGVRPGVRKKEELVLFTRQLSTMISAGIPLLECMEILQEQAESKQFALLLDGVIEQVRAGQDLSTSLDQYPKVFTTVYVSMVRAGESSGQLDEILVRLAEYLEATQRLKREIRSAMTYPTVSLLMILGITAFLLIVIVPKFEDIFKQMDITMPALTRGIMSVAKFVEAQYAMVFGGMVLAFLLLMVFKRTQRGRYIFDWFKLHVPVFGPLFRKVALSRFSKTSSTMIKSGVPILGSLEIVAETSGNAVIERVVLEARDSVRKGESLAAPLSQSSEFPPMVTRMIGIGEKTGAMEQLLDKIAEFYEEQVSASVKQLTSLIEPIMIAVMGVLVGTIVLAIFLPIFEIQKKLAAR